MKWAWLTVVVAAGSKNCLLIWYCVHNRRLLPPNFIQGWLGMASGVKLCSDPCWTSQKWLYTIRALYPLWQIIKKSTGQMTTKHQSPWCWRQKQCVLKQQSVLFNPFSLCSRECHGWDIKCLNTSVTPFISLSCPPLFPFLQHHFDVGTNR